MFRCCCTEEDTQEIDLKPIGVAALSGGPDQVQVDRGEPGLAAKDGSSALPLGSTLAAASAAAAAKAEAEEKAREEKARDAGNTNSEVGGSARGGNASEAERGEQSAAKAPPADFSTATEEPPEAFQEPAKGIGETMTWDINVSNSVEGLGIRLFVMPSTIAVSYIGPGSISRYNSSNPSQAVEVNDFIKAVNGKTTIRDMAEALAAKTVRTLTMYRAVAKQITVIRDGTFGGKIHALPGHTMVHIQGITDNSSLTRHNERHQSSQPQLVISSHDCITSINGVTSDALKMAQMLQDPAIKSLEMVVLRPPAPA